MTVQRAREILQEEVQGFTDDQVLELIRETGSICDGFLDAVLKETLDNSLSKRLL